MSRLLAGFRLGCTWAAPWCLVALLAAPGAVWAQMSAEEELATLRTPEGMEAVLFAAEPLVINPAAIDVDTHGRVWVAEIQWYRGRAQTDPPADSIKVLEDTDGDGRADKVTVFAEEVFAPMSICVAGSKVYVATSPDLWVYEDADGDLKADGPPTKLLTGFGGFNHDHGAHSLVLGPDHKWWMAHGDAGFDVTGTDGSHIEYSWGAMLRGELDGGKLETVAVNFRNSYEVCVSSFGEAFCSDNDNDGNESVRICWILEGGNYGWFGRPPMGKQEVARRVPQGVPFRDGWHFRAYTPGFVPGTLVTGFGSPCGICFYEGDAFGGALAGAPIHAEAGPQVVQRYPHQNAGYGMTAAIEPLLTSEGDRYYRPDDVCVAPNGGLYVSDWYDGGVGGHGYNDPDRGRIFFLKPKGKELTRREKPGPYDTVEDAVVALASPNLATQYLAREKLLAAPREAVRAVADLLDDDDRNLRARVLWLLDRIGGEARNNVVERLGDDEAAFRALAIRILRRHGDQYEKAILERADDPSPEVRREVLIAIRNWTDDAAWDALVRLAKRYDGADRYELETIHVAAADRQAELYDALAGGARPEQYGLLWALDAPRTEARLVQRLAELGSGDGDEAGAIADLLALSEDDSIARAVLAVALDDDRVGVVRRAAAAAVTRNAASTWRGALQAADGEALARVLRGDHGEIALDWIRAAGLADLAPAAVAIAADESASVEKRIACLRLATEFREESVLPVLRGIAGDGALADAAREALLNLVDGPSIRRWLTGGSGDAAAVVERLMQVDRGPWAVYALMEEADSVIAREAAERAIALAAEHPDANVRVLFEKYLPEDRRPAKLGEQFSAEQVLALEGDANRGRRIFTRSSAAQCMNCHAVAGRGRDIGPELTNIGRKYERGALLETILEPNKAISHEYVAHLVVTTGGQVYLGFLVQDDDETKVVKTAEGELVRIPAAEVEQVVKQDVSLMPELVLSEVSAQDAADLLSYLETLR